MLRESYMSSVWLAWCTVKSSPAGRERAREAEELERERQESARRTVAPPAVEAQPEPADPIRPGLAYLMEG